MGREEGLDAFVGGAGRKAKGLLNKAIQVADQTNLYSTERKHPN